MTVPTKELIEEYNFGKLREKVLHLTINQDVLLQYIRAVEERIKALEARIKALEVQQRTL